MASRSPPFSAQSSSHQYQRDQMVHNPLPQVRPPISPPRSHYDYLPNRSPAAHTSGSGGGRTPYNPTSVRHIVNGMDITTRPTTGASPSHTNTNGTSPDIPRHTPSMSQSTEPSPVIPRKRAQVEDILNPVDEEITKPPQPAQQPDPSTSASTASKTPRPSTTAATPTPTPRQIIPPSSGSGAITISSSTVTSSKSTPDLSPAAPLQPVKRPKSIRIHVPLNDSSNVYINFASLAEKKYGPEIFNSKRLLGPQGFASSFLNHDRILETGSDSEAEDDDAAPEGAEGAEGGEGGDVVGKRKMPVKRRRRQNVADKYDVEDPFIDDSEALMEQVAAASKDGFFVYSGPLIAEGERAKIDKAEQPKKRKAPVKKPAGEKVARAKKGEKKEKGKSVASGVDEVPQVIAS